MGYSDIPSLGGGGNGFGIVQTPSGTSPTATKPDDSLTLTSASAEFTMSGNSTSDTVDFALSGKVAKDLDLQSNNITGVATLLGATSGSIDFWNAAGHVNNLTLWGGNLYFRGICIWRDDNVYDIGQAGNRPASIHLGTGLRIVEGTNKRMGVATLAGGTVTVANTSVTANTRIFLTVQTAGGTQGFLSTTRTAGTSFTINSTSASETSVVAWLLVEPD
jgi:hypothetical protein